MKRFSTFRIVITALFAALVCVATMLVPIPIPATGGYANLGDGIILISAFLLDPVCAVLASGLGSMLADVLAGYASFAPATLVIKAGVALIAGFILNRFGKSENPGRMLAVMIVSGIAAEIFMILGYFFYEGVVLGLGMGAAAGIPGNIGQGAVGVVIACVVAPVLTKSREVMEMMNKTK
ncbi:MAG: ECF transporter S component [Clostridiales bacterium]|nr:ECF transporter S component [Clostridiales bacterium]